MPALATSRICDATRRWTAERAASEPGGGRSVIVGRGAGGRKRRGRARRQRLLYVVGASLGKHEGVRPAKRPPEPPLRACGLNAAPGSCTIAAEAASRLHSRERQQPHDYHRWQAHRHRRVRRDRRRAPRGGSSAGSRSTACSARWRRRAWAWSPPTAAFVGLDDAGAPLAAGEMTRADVAAIADRLMAAYDNATTLAPISAGEPGFDVAAAYDVLAEIERRRRAQGWQSGRAQDRIHQPHDLGALRRLPADVGARLDAHRAVRAVGPRDAARSPAWCSRASSPRSSSS